MGELYRFAMLQPGQAARPNEVLQIGDVAGLSDQPTPIAGARWCRANAGTIDVEALLARTEVQRFAELVDALRDPGGIAANATMATLAASSDTPAAEDPTADLARAVTVLKFAPLDTSRADRRRLTDALRGTLVKRRLSERSGDLSKVTIDDARLLLLAPLQLPRPFFRPTPVIGAPRAGRAQPAAQARRGTVRRVALDVARVLGELEALPLDALDIRPEEPVFEAPQPADDNAPAPAVRPSVAVLRSADGLSDRTRQVLTGLGIGDERLDGVAVNDLREALDLVQDVVAPQALGLEAEAAPRTVRVGSASVTIIEPPATPATGWAPWVGGAPFEVVAQLARFGIAPEAVGLDFDEDEQPAAAADPEPSGLTSKGTIRLLLVEQDTVRYEQAEVSHIENVMRGESRWYGQSSRVTSELVTESETETTTTEESSVATTDRLELETETSNMVEESSRLTAGVKVSASYGKFVEVEAQVGVDRQTRQQEAASQATRGAKETVEEARKVVETRVRRAERRRVLEESEARNVHAFTNTDPTSATHFSGIYQWINKVSLAQVQDYGFRDVYDLILPEPAAFLIQRHARAAADDDDPPPKKPRMSNVTRNTWKQQATKYGVALEPPPPKYSVAGASISTAPKNEESNPSESGSLGVKIPAGYEPRVVVLNCLLAEDDEGGAVDAWASVAVGPRQFRFEIDAEPQRFRMPIANSVLDSDKYHQQAGEQGPTGGTVPVSFVSTESRAIAINVNILCLRTKDAMAQWQSKAFGQLMTGYVDQLAAWEARQAAKRYRGPETSPLPAGGNPLLNRDIEAAEIRRLAITRMRNQEWDFDGYPDRDEDDTPVLDTAALATVEAELQFLEHAFEWRNLSYVLYPYYWGARSSWTRVVDASDPDPLFASFLRAGACRVQVPVRPGFEEDVKHYMLTREPYGGAGMPDVGDASYVPFIQEQMEQLGKGDAPTPWGEPWEVVLPTSLVKLAQGQDITQWPNIPADPA